MILEAFGTEFGYMIDYEEFEAIAESDLMNDDQEARMLTHRYKREIVSFIGFYDV